MNFLVSIVGCTNVSFTFYSGDVNAHVHDNYDVINTKYIAINFSINVHCRPSLL